MSGRTVAVGDIHGELEALEKLICKLPPLDSGDTLLFIGDYIDRGPSSAGVVAFLRQLPQQTAARVVLLRGSHEDGWLKVLAGGFANFVAQMSNGCLATCRSFSGGAVPGPDEAPTQEEYQAMFSGSFFPQEVLDWMAGLALYWEDDHAIYVHAGLPRQGERWLHPSEVQDPSTLMWQRSKDFFADYSGKRVVFGHTTTELLPQQFSLHTPEDTKDVYIRDSLVGLDTGCGRGGFLSAVELPSLTVYETR